MTDAIGAQRASHRKSVRYMRATRVPSAPKATSIPRTMGKAAIRMNSRRFLSLGRNAAASSPIVRKEISDARLPCAFASATAPASGIERLPA